MAIREISRSVYFQIAIDKAHTQLANDIRKARDEWRKGSMFYVENPGLENLNSVYVRSDADKEASKEQLRKEMADFLARNPNAAQPEKEIRLSPEEAEDMGLGMVDENGKLNRY